MFCIFIVDNDFGHVYFSTVDNFSEVLTKLKVQQERVQFVTVPMELLAMILDNQVSHVMREH